MTDTARDYLEDQIEALPCLCGHLPAHHKHLDACRYEDCWCPVYRPEEEPREQV